MSTICVIIEQPVEPDAVFAPHLARVLAERPPRAGSLVVSVFGDAVVPHGGAIWLGSLIRWLLDFGIHERAVRTAVHRLAADDWFTATSTGRRSDYRLTRGESASLCGRRATYLRRRAFLLGRNLVDRGPRPRDTRGRSPRPRSARASLARVRRARADRSRPPLGRRRRVGAGARATWGSAGTRSCCARKGDERLPGGRTSVRELVASAWDLRHLAAEYRAYVRRFTPLAERLGGGATPSPPTLLSAAGACDSRVPPYPASRSGASRGASSRSTGSERRPAESAPRCTAASRRTRLLSSGNLEKSPAAPFLRLRAGTFADSAACVRRRARGRFDAAPGSG